MKDTIVMSKRPVKLYIMYTGVFCKIGLTSRKIEDRIREVQTNCPLPIYKCDIFTGFGKTEAHCLERDIQDYLSRHITFGEWFRQFENIKKSVSLVIKSKSNTLFEVKTINLKNNIFEDLSVRLLYKIKNACYDKDLSTLSTIYTQLNKNDLDYNETRFVLYSKESVSSLLNSSIRFIIKDLKSNDNIPANIIKNFIFDESKAKNNKQLKSIRKLNNSASIQAIMRRD